MARELQNSDNLRLRHKPKINKSVSNSYLEDRTDLVPSNCTVCCLICCNKSSRWGLHIHVHCVLCTLSRSSDSKCNITDKVIVILLLNVVVMLYPYTSNLHSWRVKYEGHKVNISYIGIANGLPKGLQSSKSWLISCNAKRWKYLEVSRLNVTTTQPNGWTQHWSCREISCWPSGPSPTSCRPTHLYFHRHNRR